MRQVKQKSSKFFSTLYHFNQFCYAYINDSFRKTSTMSTLVEKIKAIEDEMARTQKNKATSAHLGMLKAKYAMI